MSAAQGHKGMAKHQRSQTFDLSNSVFQKGGLLRGATGSALSRPRSSTTAASTQVRPGNPQPQPLPAKPEPQYQRFVMSDPVAFSYLEEDPATSVLERAHIMQGYQSYIVEQWVVSRTHPTFMITAFTGDSNHKITVSVLSVPADEDSWSPRLKVYFKTLAQYHAKRKETPMGTLMVTNIAGFPSSLTLIAVSDGDVKKHREDFFVNENLKRFGCMGRSGISLSKPSGPTRAKFYQLFRTSEKADFYTSVIDLVKLCQAALMLFDKLEPEYADGLLCDVTERAFHDWWAEIGAELYSVEPKDGIVSPTTVAALLGTLIGARNRLHAYGAPVAKDVFDIDATKRAINYFQKSQHLPKTRRLDRTTLFRLHKATMKQASAEGWTVPRAVKSTVAELSGKGGEMVMDMVGGGKASLAEVETTDIERFSQLVKGDRCKWLWQGKQRKRHKEDLFGDHPGTIVDRTKEAQADHLDSADDFKSPTTPFTPLTPDAAGLTREVSQNDPRKTIFQRTTGRFGRGTTRRGHNSRPSEDDDMVGRLSANRSVESVTSEARSGADERHENFFDQNKANNRKHLHRFSSKRDHNMQNLFGPLHLPNGLSQSSAECPQPPHAPAPVEQDAEPEEIPKLEQRPSQVVRDQLSAAAAVARETDFDALRNLTCYPGDDTGVLLRRTLSFSRYIANRSPPPHIDSFPRHLSFSAAEDAILFHHAARPASSDSDAPTSDTSDTDAAIPPNAGRKPTPAARLQHELHLATRARDIRAALASLGARTGTWMLAEVRALSALEATVAQDAGRLAALHAPRAADHAALAEGSAEIVGVERARLQDALRDVETLGQRLEYEVAGLRDKVEDVESAVAEFERQVLVTEERVAELVRQPRRGGPAGGGGAGGVWGWLESVFVRRGGAGSGGAPARQGLEKEDSEAVEDDDGPGADEKAAKRMERERLESEESTPRGETSRHIEALLQG